MEAMSCACCPVATRVGGNPELVEHGENGLLFPVDAVDALAQQLRVLVEDEAQRKRMAQAASAKIAERFTFAKAASAMQEIYEAVLNAKRGGKQTGASPVAPTLAPVAATGVEGSPIALTSGRAQESGGR